MIFLEKEFQLNEGCDYSFINPFSLGVVAQELTEEEQAKFKFYADGIAVVIYARLLKNKKIVRTSFDDTSVAPAVFNFALKNKRSIYLVGGSKENITEAEQLLKIKYPGIKIIGVHAGFFENDNAYNLFLNSALNSDFLIVGMGAGKQEKTLLDIRKKGWTGTGFTCGGYFDQFVEAKGEDYYPEFINNLHLRWLYRMCKEPRRLLRRYLIDYPYYLIKFGHKVR